MVSMLLLRDSESLLLHPPLPEPPPFVFLLDLLTGVSAPDPPDPPNASETLVALDLFSLPCYWFTLATARSPLHSTKTSDSVCLLIVSLGVNLVKPLLLPTDGITWKGVTLVTPLDVSIWDGTYLRIGFLVLRIRNHLRPLPQYEDLMLLVSHCFTHYEAVRHLFYLHLPQYEVHLPQYEARLPLYEAQLPQHEIYSQFQGSSRWCLITSVAKFLAALYTLVAAACPGSSSLSVFSNSGGFISLSTHGVSLLTVSLSVLLFLLNNSSIDGV
ncbi:hypothetical protein Bca101_060735 [Brassica carinata]